MHGHRKRSFSVCRCCRPSGARRYARAESPKLVTEASLAEPCGELLADGPANVREQTCQAAF